MLLSLLLGLLALLSLVITLWQWVVALRFPLHQRVADKTFAPAVTLLKPLKGCDSESEASLRSWMTQDYAGAVQILFGVASSDDPVCEIVKGLVAEFPRRDAQLVVCEESLGTNAKVSTLIQLQRLAKHDVVIVSDADVRVPPDFLVNAVAPLKDSTVGLVNCFYRLANPATSAMQWEAVAINSDFWSQVLQSASLKPIDFALGAVMVTRRKQLDEIGGFASLADFLADDYRLGNLIAQKGHRIALCPVVVECWSAPMNWREVWAHQLRWARTIRVCQPLPYFSSIISNATIWPLLWSLASVPFATVKSSALSENASEALAQAFICSLLATMLCVTTRIGLALHLQFKLNRGTGHFMWWWLVPVKDLLNAVIWALAFFGNRVEWRGHHYRVESGGKLVKV